jgi:hypothetical protein
MNRNQTTETELRHAVIDRLIAASLRDATPAREATLERWRAQAIEKTVARQTSQAA